MIVKIVERRDNRFDGQPVTGSWAAPTSMNIGYDENREQSKTWTVILLLLSVHKTNITGRRLKMSYHSFSSNSNIDINWNAE